MTPHMEGPPMSHHQNGYKFTVSTQKDIHSRKFYKVLESKVNQSQIHFSVNAPK